MIESRCGLCCTVCSYREPNDCPGCTRQPKPFWGECPVKRCAERRGWPIAAFVRNFRAPHCTTLPMTRNMEPGTVSA